MSIVKKINFLTTNQGKVASLANRLTPGKYQLVQTKLELPEIQAASASAVCLEKAKEAFKILQQPLIIQDSSFHMLALHGFPGAYIKYIQDSIGLEGILKLMEGVEDRRCYFEGALTYIDKDITKTFVKKGSIGRLATKIDSTHSQKEWGAIWRIFIPSGFDIPLSAISKEELDAKEKNATSDSEFAQFVRWIEADNERESFRL